MDHKKRKQFESTAIPTTDGLTQNNYILPEDSFFSSRTGDLENDFTDLYEI